MKPAPFVRHVPGTLDEVRLSTTAHTRERIVASMQGTDINRVTSIQPAFIQRASAPVTVSIQLLHFLPRKHSERLLMPLLIRNNSG